MIRFLTCLVLAITLAGCGDRWQDYSYKMTIYADGKAYSVVRHVTVEEGSTIQDSTGRRVDYRTEGQAVIIETPKGPVFALMKPEQGDFGFGYYAARITEPALMNLPAREDRADRAINKHVGRIYGNDHLADNAERHNAMLEVKGPRDLPRTIPNPNPIRKEPVHVWPMLVRFDQLDMPASVRKVSPESVGISRITIEVTNEPVTMGIDKRLNWLPGLNGRYLNGTIAARGSPYGLEAGDFSSNVLSENLGSGYFRQREDR